MRVQITGQVVGLATDKTTPTDGKPAREFRTVSILQSRKLEKGTAAEVVQVKLWGVNGFTPEQLAIGKQVTLPDVVIRAYVPSRGGTPVVTADVFDN